MATEQRLYVIAMKDGAKRLIDASNPAHALRHVARTIVESCEAAKARDVAELVGAGVKIEQAAAVEAGE